MIQGVLRHESAMQVTGSSFRIAAGPRRWRILNLGWSLHLPLLGGRGRDMKEAAAILLHSVKNLVSHSL